MSGRLMVVLAGALVSAALVAGCGGGDETSAENPPLTKAQFAKQGTQVCAEALKKMSKQLGAFAETHDLTKKLSKEDAEGLVDTVFEPGFEAQLEGLQGLSPPKGDEKQIEAMLAQFEEGLEKGAEEKTKFVAALSKAMRALEKYGVKECDGLYLQ